MTTFHQNWKGETVFQEEKKARDELSRILHKFDIFIDNPLIILQQEVAKLLLNDLKPEKVFMFIMKATMLEEIRSWYKEADNELHKLKANFKEKEESLKDLQNHVKELQERIKEDNTRMEKDQEFRKTVKELSWKKIHLLKRNLTVKELELESVEKRRDCIHENLILQHKNVPTGVSMVVSLDGYKFYPPNGNYSYRSYYMDAKKTLDFLDNSPILENKKNIDHIEKDLAKQAGIGRSFEKLRTKIQGEIEKIQEEIKKKNQVWTQMRQNKTQHFTNNSLLIAQLKELE